MYEPDMRVNANVTGGTIGFWAVFFATLFSVGIVGAIITSSMESRLNRLLFELALIQDYQKCEIKGDFEQAVVRWNVEEGTIPPPNDDPSYRLVATIPDPNDSGSVFLIFQKVLGAADSYC